MFERGGIWVSRPGWILFSGIAKGCGLKIAPWKDDMSNEDKEKSECERAEEDIKTLQKLAKKLTGNCQTVAKNLLDFKQKYVKDHNCDSFKKK